MDRSKLVDEAARRESEQKPLGWWWLSFCDIDKPQGQSFVGVAIVEGNGVASAAMRAHALGVNPGGEVQGVELTGDAVPPPEYRNRLLNKEQLANAGLI